ncbi:hypothetical protein V6C27_04085 [Peptococcaceae bacterium 1198_IL3148]
MSHLLQKIALVLTGLMALWFAFAYVHQPTVPFYHNMVLFVVSWVLFYSLLDIAFQPVSAVEIPNTDKKRQKIRRKNSTTVNKG